MSFKTTFFFGGIVFLAGCNVGHAQQPQDQTIAWYKSFFGEKTPKAAEEELRLTSEKLKEATTIKDAVSSAQLSKAVGLIYLLNMHSYEKAMDLFIQALAIEDSLGLKKEQVFTYLAIAQTFEEVGDPFKSAESLQQALMINDRFRDVPTLVYILSKLGKTNAAMGRIEEAFENYEHVLHYIDEIGDPGVEGEALFNVAHLYRLQANYDKALQMHKRALAIRRAMGDRKNEAQSLNDIGALYHLMKNDDKALANHVVALEIRRSLDDKKGLAASYNNISALYYNQKNYARAIANLQLALAAALDAQEQEQIRKSYDYLSLCYKALGDYEKALAYKDLFTAINDFIQNERNERQLAETQNGYVINKKQSQIDKLESIRLQREKELKAQKQFRNFLIALIGLGIVVVLLVLYLYMIKRRSNKILKVANTRVHEQNIALKNLNATKDKFFSIISHDLKGPLNSLTSFSGLLINHTDSLSKEEIKMLANDLDKSLKNLFALLENLLEWSRSQTGSITFTPEKFDLGALLEQNKALLQPQAANKNIDIHHTHDKDEFYIIAHRHSVNTVVRNLVSNAIKFTPPGGDIFLEVRQDDGKVIVSVKDTGVGMTDDVVKKLFRIDTKHSTKGTAEEKGTGLGLILCKEFIEKNNGSIWVESEEGKGSVFYFSLPLPANHSPKKSLLAGVK